ncbi:MAG: YtxH domain-containing protein [Anaerolineales bacterium]|nr:YtxH domain-containing protein [Anaerolineales bacterium]MCB9432018.1 YtxH domain-containing protein [Ardenticatenaceae bacterium]
MSENNNDLGAFLAGFVIGGLVGAATAIILAPQSGSETRSQLMNQSQDLRQMSNERLQQVRQQAGEATKDVRDRAGTAFADARSQAHQVTGQMQEQARIVLDAGKDRAGQVRNQVNSFVKRENGTATE